MRTKILQRYNCFLHFIASVSQYLHVSYLDFSYMHTLRLDELEDKSICYILCNASRNSGYVCNHCHDSVVRIFAARERIKKKKRKKNERKKDHHPLFILDRDCVGQCGRLRSRYPYSQKDSFKFLCNHCYISTVRYIYVNEFIDPPRIRVLHFVMTRHVSRYARCDVRFSLLSRFCVANN